MLPDYKTILDKIFIFGDIPPNAEMGEYTGILVLVSYIIATIGSFAGLRLATNIQTANTKKSMRLNHIGGALTFGTGIWSMHFIGMLAYDMEMLHTYDPLLTICSMGIAVISAYGVLQIIRAEKITIPRIISGGILLGGAICGMHYMGMAAMEMDADLKYTPILFALSIIIAITASIAALWIVLRLAKYKGKYKIWWQMLAALIVGFAICGMHYTGMAASIFIPYADCRYDPNQTYTALALAVSILSCGIFIIAIMLGSNPQTTKKAKTTSGTRVFLHLSALLGIFLIMIVGTYIYTTNNTIERKNDEQIINAAGLGRLLLTGYAHHASIAFIAEIENQEDVARIHIKKSKKYQDILEGNQNSFINGGKLWQDKYGETFINFNGFDDQDIKETFINAKNKWIKLKSLHEKHQSVNHIHKPSDLSALEQYHSSHLEQHLQNAVSAQQEAVSGINTRFKAANDRILLKENITLILGIFTYLITVLYVKFFIANSISRTENELYDIQDNLEEKIEEQTRDIRLSQIEAEKTSQIPLNNPNPVFQLALDGTPKIINPAAIEQFPGLAIEKFNTPLLSGLKDFAETFQKSSPNTFTQILRREHEIENAIFFQTIVPMEIDGEKTLMVYCHDISIVKKAQKDLDEQKTFLNTLVENLPMALFAKDVKDGYKYIAWNKEAENTFGIKASQTLGTTDHDHFIKEEADFFVKMDHKVIEERQLVKIEQEPVTTKAKGTFIAQTFKMPIYDSKGEPIILLGLLQDVTNTIRQQKELEQAKIDAEAASAAKSDFLANMSHEIRTPMNAVLGMSNLMMDTRLEPEQQEYVKGINSAGNTLLHIINDIIDVSKIEAGKLTLEKTDFQLFDMIQEVTNMYMYQAREKNLELILDIDNDIPNTLKGDPTRLKQIFANLIGNALKFTKTGHILITLQQIDTTQDTTIICCEIQDTGIGIAKNKQKKIFEKFTQAEESTTRKHGGTGLGLNIVSELINVMGGEIRVKSEPNKGSTFFFNIMFENADQEETKSEDFSDIKKKKLKALIIDDNAAANKVLKSVLKNHKITTKTAENHTNALKILKEENDYNICIIDHFMDGKNGIDLAKKIKKNKTLSHIALMLISDVSDIGPTTKLTKAGFDGYIRKPFKSNDVMCVIKTVINAKEKKETFPLITKHNARSASYENENTAKEYAQYPNLKVLAVEDMKMNMVIIKKVLGKFGCKIDTAINGVEAFEKAKENEYDVIFMDCQMPEMDGFDSTKEIRKFEEKHKRNNAAIVALTADAMVGDREKCLAVGMSDYINKPFKEDDIAKALAKWAPTSKDT